MNEARYQAKLLKKIRNMFPGCFILKNDPSWLQGVPDILILYHNRWGALEIKLDDRASHRPNQDHYIGLLNEMSFASFINPETEEMVLYDLQRSLGSTR